MPGRPPRRDARSSARERSSVARTITRPLALASLFFALAVPTSEAAGAERRGRPNALPGTAAPEASLLPRGAEPPVVAVPAPWADHPRRQNAHASVGWTHALLHPAFDDRRRRVPRAARPHDFGHTLQVGEAFGFDLTFGGNPAGLAEASIVAIEPDPRGRAPTGAPAVRLEGHARTSGIVSILATVTDDVSTLVDAETGAVISAENVIRYSGWTPVKFRHRVTRHDYQGRGYVRIVDTKDKDVFTKTRRVPLDTFDALSAMAWVRSLPLEQGDRAKAHVIDGTTLLRVEIESHGVTKLDTMPSMGHALGLGDEALLISGSLTRVDPFDQPLPGKRVYEMRAWLTPDERRIPLLLTSDMWVGELRLTLTRYDPPRDRLHAGLPTEGQADAAPVGGPGRAPERASPRAQAR